MSQDIIERFNQIRSEFKYLVFRIQSTITDDGTIVLSGNRGCGIFLCILGVLIPGTLAILILNALRRDVSASPSDYVFVAFPGFISILFIVGLVYVIMCHDTTIFTINTALSQIVTYGAKFPARWGPRETIRLDDIQLFLAYQLKLWQRSPAPKQNYVYIVTNDGVAHAFGPSWSPDKYARSLGYVCQKSVVYILESEPSLGPASDHYSGPPIYDGCHINISRLMSKGQILYDPETDDYFQVPKTIYEFR